MAFDISKQEVEQIVQAAVQSTIEQVLQTSGQFQADKKVIGYTADTEDTQTDEAIRGKTLNDSEMWGLNKKLLNEREQATAQRSADHDRELKEIAVKSAQVELARKQHDYAIAQQLDQITVQSAQDAALIRHLTNMEYVKFNAAASDPISPNSGAGK